MRKIGVNKYGIKLEDHVDYASYRRAYRAAVIKAWFSTEEGKLARYKASTKYSKTEKGIKSINKYNKSEKRKLSYSKYSKSGKGIVKTARYNSSVNGRKVKNANGAKRRSLKLQRTPAWADLEAIKQFYLNCPKGYEVDHIVPLQGVNVSGFHVLSNLQYLTKSENCSKGNKYDV